MQLSLHQHDAAGLRDCGARKALEDGHNDGLGAELEGGFGGAQLGGGGSQTGCKCPHHSLQIYHAQLRMHTSTSTRVYKQ